MLKTKNLEAKKSSFCNKVTSSQLVHVNTGTETSNIQFRLSASPTFTVTVKVVGAGNGAGDNHYFVSLVPTIRNEAVVSPMGAPYLPSILTDADGVVKQRGIRPGEYRIQVTHAYVNDRGGAGTDNASPGGSAVINVVDRDVTIEVPLSTFPPNRGTQ